MYATMLWHKRPRPPVTLVDEGIACSMLGQNHRFVLSRGCLLLNFATLVIYPEPQIRWCPGQLQAVTSSVHVQ